MVLNTLRKLFKRDLQKLATEITSYKSEGALWAIKGDILNSGGTLCLHLIGNLNAYIGAELGNTGYKRQREKEFSQRDVPKAELLREIGKTQKMVDHTLDCLDEGVLEEEYPLLVFREKMTTGYFLIHLATHLTYHLGQINYHRRLLDS
ncbi:DinB family protein [Flavobacteriaceae bacterium TP-CH-4]|uniref:DinB family protein n=1 Tax=Pelagihabitans pacificus TaxID=2696054 RepID=A0A967E6N9_9FLAO|nr:DinB family protein [Pelagihabitans pacificus]NHF60722.1 DinB family protein [Pelagihabitans pacificus]